MHVIFSHKPVPCNHEKDCPKNDTHISTFLIEITLPSHKTTHVMCSQGLFATLYFAKKQNWGRFYELQFFFWITFNKNKHKRITKSNDETLQNRLIAWIIQQIRITLRQENTLPLCQQKQYAFVTCAYWFSMAFTKLSPVSVNERKKCLVKSEKDSGAHRPPTPMVA